MSTTTNVAQVKLNVMTQAQYDVATKSPTELYMITDAQPTPPANMQTTTNLVTSVSSSSTDSQYPSAKLFYDTCGDIETLINAL